MSKKLAVLTYVRGLFLLVVLSLLFLTIRPWEEEPPPLMQSPIPQVQEAEAVTNPFQFAVFSDSHKGWGVFKPIMKQIARDEYVFAITLGDFVAQSKEDRYRFFFKELVDVKGETPLFFVPGNHDVHDDNATYSLESYWKYCGPDHYWFSWENAAFVVVNDSRSTITADQFHWLKNTLRKLRGDFKHIFVFMHVPPFDPREGQSYCLPKSDGEQFMALMEKFAVDYVFCGHIQCYFREVINGVTYIICGGAGGGLKCPDTFDTFHHYVRVAVEGEEIQDSVIRAERNLWIEITVDLQYDMRLKYPFLLPFLTAVMGQSFLSFLAL
jgi:predicted phosphodiesterase